VTDSTAGSTVVIRDIDGVSELRAVEALQKEVWGSDDLDVVPLTLLVASRAVGATLIGAYDEESLIGFVYGFTGYEHGQVTHHSHMLAVSPAYRKHKLGFKLKLAQRERVLAQGITRITWTFDPLQSLNAHLNFGKLGVVSDKYKTNFYGDATSSFLHQIGTDRLWVTWLLDSPRVRERLQTTAIKNQPLIGAEDEITLVRVSVGCVPERHNSFEIFDRQRLAIEIPWDINILQRREPRLALEWREATRSAFRKALDAKYLVEDFGSVTRNDQRIGVYLLSLRKDNSELFVDTG
jgi:predicted GNAT superfamily acetyltransferase